LLRTSREKNGAAEVDCERMRTSVYRGLLATRPVNRQEVFSMRESVWSMLRRAGFAPKARGQLGLLVGRSW